MTGQIFVFSAPSGTGKSTIAEALMERFDRLAYSISHTSRPPRGAEQDGIGYHFVTESDFREMIQKNAFLEWAQVHDHLYGTAFDAVKAQMSAGSDILMDVDVQGGRSVKKQFPESVLIFLLPPSLEILRKRLTDRGTDDPAAIKKRMEKASEEIKHCSWYDYIIINDDLEKAVFEAESIIVSARCKKSRRIDWVAAHFADFP
ncbi:MAG: guanylate kinase [Desulfobacteraceae bacterium 4572_87]|nr:MAG: guanylate kinase [Desulfobacteraceae bacterium 4572_87]